jgi:hypothetical protein
MTSSWTITKYKYEGRYQMRYGVFFSTTTAAMQAQKALTTKGYSTTLIPAPKQFNSPSGMAVRFNLMEK